MDVAVSGTVVAAGVSPPPTANWDIWADRTINLVLAANTNTIRATATTANGGPKRGQADGDRRERHHLGEPVAEHLPDPPAAGRPEHGGRTV